MDLQHLFDIKWRSDADVETVVPAGGGEGAHIGNGRGTIQGPRINGEVRFSFYTGDCPFDPGFLADQGKVFADFKDHMCTINPVGIIETDDGAAIQFDVRGFGLRLEKHAPLWSLTGGVRLVTDDERYRWLNESVGTWEGSFDEQTSTGRYRVCARIAD